jgi:phytoene synthase
MPDAFDAAEIDARVARVDADRHMAARFAPPEDRARLIALYAFNYEIARVRESVSEPAIGDMRLAWWREAVDEVYDPRRFVRRHEAAVALERAFAGRQPPRLWVDRLINARARDLDQDPFLSLDELQDYAEATAGQLMRIAAWLLAPDAELTEEAEAAITHAGAAWAIAGLVRALPEHLAQGRPALPVDLSELTGAGGDDPDAWRIALEPVMHLAREQHEFARAAYPAVPPACAPACLYAALTPVYLARIERRDDPRRDGVEIPRLERQARLVGASARGRI